VIGIAITFAVYRWARRRQEATGQQFPTGWAGLGLIIGLPLLVFLASGAPIVFDWPALRGFNFVGGLRIIPEFTALLIALTTYTASFIAEIVRAGILAVPFGQTEAAYSLGLRRGATLRLVVIPQALRVVVPLIVIRDNVRARIGSDSLAANGTLAGSRRGSDPGPGPGPGPVLGAPIAPGTLSAHRPRFRRTRRRLRRPGGPSPARAPGRGSRRRF